jgi:hypothetical protein
MVPKYVSRVFHCSTPNCSLPSILQFQLHTLLVDLVVDVNSSLHCVHFESHMWLIVLIDASNLQNLVLLDQILDYAKYQQHKNMLGENAT